MKIKDVNGKEFEFSVEDVNKMVTDSPDYCDNVLDAVMDNVNFTPSVLDSQGNKVNVSKLLNDINEGKEKVPTSIDVLFEATHTGKNLNYFIYHSDSMANDVTSWKSPYNKPLLKNHYSNSEPMGRVQEAYFEESEFCNSKDCCNLNYRVTDKNAIMKFLDGRYKTVSIGGNCKTIVCSICGKKIYDNGKFNFCGHWRGERYNSVMCYWSGRDIVYNECSVVNNPADGLAQVKKITIANGKGDNMPKPTQNDNKDNVNNNDLDNIIDKAFDKDNKPQNENNNENPEKEKENSTEDNIDNKDKDLIKKLEKKVNDLKADNKLLNDTNSKISSKNKILEDNNDSLRDNIIQLAVDNKNLKAKRITDYMLFNNELKDNEIKNKINSLIILKSKTLTDMCSNLKIKFNSPTNPTQNSNPNLPNNNEPNSDVSDDKGENNENNIKDNNKKYISLEEYEKEFINSTVKSK